AVVIDELYEQLSVYMTTLKRMKNTTSLVLRQISIVLSLVKENECPTILMLEIMATRDLAKKAKKSQLIDKRKLIDALALSDRCLRDGGILRRLEAFVASPIGCGGSDVGIA
ncbi:hypothetical protein Tco_0911994, partial [Tanacetum coccineum]